MDSTVRTITLWARQTRTGQGQASPVADRDHTQILSNRIHNNLVHNNRIRNNHNTYYTITICMFFYSLKLSRSGKRLEFQSWGWGT